MKTVPIVPARIDWDGAVPRAPAFDDLYHPAVGAQAQATHVFLHGNGLPARWRGRPCFVVLETGFGLGHNFIAAWRAWRDDAERCARLVFVSIEKHPPRRDDLARAHADADAGTRPLATELLRAWPALTPNLHALDFDGGRVQLLLALGDIAALLPQLHLHADAFFLDGFAPARNPAMWAAPVLKALGRLAAPGATAATWSVARELRDGLAAAGFEVERASGIGGKREISVARYAPRFTPRRSAGFSTQGDARDPSALARPGSAVVVGAGIAGAAVARALADAGLAVTVLESAADVATGGSGNEGGLFHGSIGPDDGPHQRLLRAAALEAARCYAPALRSGAVPGALDGLLWLDRREGSADPMLALHTLRAQHAATGLPADYVDLLDGEAASARAGLALDAPAWLYPDGGWIAPRAWIAQALQGLALRCDAPVQTLERIDDGWCLRAPDGRVLAAAPLVVLANAADAPRLAAPVLEAAGAAPWPLVATRGQVELVLQPPARPRLPLTGDGYALTLPDGRVLIGATRAPHGDDRSALPTTPDRSYNLDRASRLTGRPWSDAPAIVSRAALRLHARDRQPLAGAVHASAPGLFVLTALGARGLTLAPLLARLVAAQALGEPWPLERDLAAAVAPSRWELRRNER